MTVSSPVAGDEVRRLPALRVQTGAYVVLALGALYALRFILLAAHKYATHQYGWDMAIYNQVISNIAFHGRPLSTAYTDATMNHFGIHFSPIYYLFAVFYRLAPSPLTLVSAQMIGLALGALPLYSIVERRLGPAIGLLFAAGYLLNPITQAISLYEFHEIAFFVPLMLAVLWAYDRGRTKVFWVLVVLTLCIREDTAGYLAVFGLVAMWNGRRRQGLQVAIVSSLWLLVVYKGVMPWLRGGAPYLFDDRFAGLHKPGFLWHDVLASREKWLFVGQLMVTVAFLPLLARRHRLLLVPGILFSVLSSFPTQYNIESHYTAPTFPFLYYTALVGLERLRPRWRSIAGGAMIAGTLLLGIGYGRLPLLNSGRVADEEHAWDTFDPNVRFLNLAIGAIPRTASVRADNTLLARVSGRQRVYILPWGAGADYALVNLRPDAQHLPATWDQVRTMLRELLTSGGYGVVYGDDVAVLVGRGQSSARNAEYLQRLGP